MRELNVNEIKEVNGGIYPYVVGWAVGHALDYMVESYGGYWENAVNDGWGSGPQTLPSNSAGFGTL